jgi:hypothetical protein
VSTALVPLDTLGKEIAAQIERGDKAAAKAEEHYISAGQRLAEARTRVAAEGSKFTDFLAKHDIGRSRAYDILAVTDGRKTFDGIRAKAAERAARHADKNREARVISESVTNGQRVRAATEDEQVAAFKAAWNNAGAETRRIFAEWVGIVPIGQPSQSDLIAEIAALKARIAELESDVETLTATSNESADASVEFAHFLFRQIPAEEMPHALALYEKADKWATIRELRRLHSERDSAPAIYTRADAPKFLLPELA